MRRIAHATATVDNKFTNGDPALSVPATVVEDYWLSMVQEEICSVIEAAGLAVGVDATADEDQLLQAIQILSHSGNVYQAVIGSAPGCTHASLADAVADAAVVAGSRLLITENQTINTMVTISKANLLIEFQPAVTFSKGSASKGIQLNADGIRIRGGRFSGFSGGSDVAIEVAAGSDYCSVSEARFASNTTDVSDLNGSTALFGNINE